MDVTRDMTDSFKRAWHAADTLGLKGKRVEEGLRAALGEVDVNVDSLGANVEGMIRVLVNDGEMTPVASRQLRKVLVAHGIKGVTP